MTSQSYQNGPFSIQHAFVVQFADHTALDAKQLVGRIEHIVSGKSVRFQSLETLVGFVMQVLETCHTSRFDVPERSTKCLSSPPNDT